MITYLCARNTSCKEYQLLPFYRSKNSRTTRNDLKKEGPTTSSHESTSTKY